MYANMTGYIFWRHPSFLDANRVATKLSGDTVTRQPVRALSFGRPGVHCMCWYSICIRPRLHENMSNQGEITQRVKKEHQMCRQETEMIWPQVWWC